MSNIPDQITLRPELLNIPLIASSSCTRLSGNYGRHLHDHVEIWYVLSGTVKHTLNDNVYIQKPGSCITVLPYMIHSYNTADSEESPILFCIIFDDHALTERGYDFFSYYNKAARFEGREIPLFRQFSGADKKEVDKIARTMLAESDRGTDMSFDLLCSLLADFLHLLCRNAPLSKNPGRIADHAKAITNAVRYIAAHYKENITLDALCTAAMMSRCRFTHNFKLITGMTSGEFILIIRLRYASLLLSLTNKTLNEIAKEVGLYDKSRLSRAFTAHYGISPSAYRKNEALTSQRLHFDTTEQRERKRSLIEYFKNQNAKTK